MVCAFPLVNRLPWHERTCNPVVMGSIPIAGSITKQQVRRVKSSGLLPFLGPRAPRRAPHRAPHFRYLGFGVALGRWPGLSAPVSSISANFANLGESAQVSEFSENGISGRTDDAREIRVSENSQGRADSPRSGRVAARPACGAALAPIGS